MLWPVLKDAAEVMASKYYARVGQCAGEGCDLIFVDRAPGSPRRWCSMRACGSKVNSRRHYRRVVKPEMQRAKAWARARRGLSKEERDKEDQEFLEAMIDGDDEPPT